MIIFILKKFTNSTQENKYHISQSYTISEVTIKKSLYRAELFRHIIQVKNKEIIKVNLGVIKNSKDNE